MRRSTMAKVDSNPYPYRVTNCLIIRLTMVLGFAVISLISLPLIAEETPTAQQRYDEAFRTMYKDASNLDKTFHFAELAIQMGDIEGAVAALERMLIIDPELPQIRLRLGALYFQIKSYAMAQTYLSEVIKHPEAPADVIADAETMLIKINSLTSAHHLTGTLVSGIRYQSNANSGPGSNEILLFGNTAVLDDQYTQQSDSDGYLTGQISHVYNFDRDPALKLETTLSLYANRQDTQKQLNTRLYELQSGLHLGLAPKPRESLDIRPYLVANRLALDGIDTFRSLGGGINVGYQSEQRGHWQFAVRIEDREHDGSGQSALDGLRSRIELARRLSLSETTAATIGISSFNEHTNDAASSHWEHGVSGTLQRGFASPFGAIKQAWTAALSLGLYGRDYDAATPTVDPDTRRSDTTIRVGANLSIPISATLALMVSVGYSEVDSNLPNFANENWVTNIGLMGRF